MVCWVAASFLIMRCFILPSARAEVFEGVGHHQSIDQVILWHPEQLQEILLDYNIQSRALYTGTESTAGLVDSLLTFFLLSVLLIYFFIKQLLTAKRLKSYIVLAVAGAIADLMASAIVGYIVLTGRHDQTFFMHAVQGLTLLQFAAYSIIIVGLSYALTLHLTQVHRVTDQSVNNS
jgi:hypothetical protein